MESARILARRINGGEASARETVAACLGAIERKNPRLGAFTFVRGKEALEEAEGIDRAVARGERAGVLAGVPVAIKSNLCSKGIPTTCCSRILENYVPPHDACAVEKLRREGAVIVGSTNMDEFGMGSSCENSALHPTLNPCDPARVPGGSSGGSAAAVAASMVPLALGSDTGGSVRQPASFCSVVGLKPTYGLVSRFGLVAFASSLDHVGTLAADVEDAFLALKVIAGKDSRDSTSIEAPHGFFAFLDEDRQQSLEKARGLRVGVVEESLLEGCDGEVLALLRSSVDRVAASGAAVEPVKLSTLPCAVACYTIIAPAEASSNLARFDGVRYGMRIEDGTPGGKVRAVRGAGFGMEVKRRIMIGTFTLRSGYYDAYYLKALKVRTALIDELRQHFRKVDVILLPTSPSPPFRLGEKTGDPLSMYLSDAYTVPANLAGIPALSVPCGKASGGLPVGLQVMAPALGEDRIFRAGLLLEHVLSRGGGGTAS
jgi:aspartyl-tRNA(Asn)/glutamyl-tRNA(Gln) amidotransferase subunit A